MFVGMQQEAAKGREKSSVLFVEYVRRDVASARDAASHKAESAEDLGICLQG